jgi:hypothetical protein
MRIVIGTTVVAASVAAGLVISGLPSQLLGSTGSSNQPTVTAPMLHYVLTGFRQPVAVRQLPPARSVLLKLARAAAHRAPIPQPAGARITNVVTNEWYMGTAVAGGTSSSVITPEVDQTWTGPHGSWRDLTHYGRPLVLGVGSKETLQALEGRQPVSDDHGGPNDSNTGPLPETFSLNPTVLARQLLNAPPDTGEGNNAYHIFDIITDLHHQIVPPQLDAAMWRMLAARSDVRYLGRVMDRAGRIGDALAYTSRDGQERAVLIISPSTGQLLGWEDIFLRNPGALNLASYPAVAGYVSFLTEHWTKTSTTGR